jgi:hypothetical protein
MDAGRSSVLGRDLLLFARSRVLVRPASKGTREDTTSRSQRRLRPRWERPSTGPGRTHLLRTTRQRLTQRPPNACPLRRAGMSVGSCSPTVCGRRACRSSRGPCSDAGNNPCRRQGDPVVAPGSTERRLLVEDDHGASGRTAISSSPIGWRRRRRPVVLSQGAHARMDVPVGEGSARPRSGQSSDVRPWPPVCARFRPRLRSSARARTARSHVVPRGRR